VVRGISQSTDPNVNINKVSKACTASVPLNPPSASAGVEIPKTRSENSVNGPVEQIVFVSDVAIEPHGAEPARLGDTPDGQRVDAFSVDDVDGGGDHVVSRDLASSAARGLLDSRHAYNVAY
jgi:hypothetical protein